ncbi:MAG TPA: NADPH:quinone oxidoreductase family protein [Bryobacteraceae bacterium]|nr:NADPH:quinone oxidoreductase family protein [Bryobacteraceae bacterium]
MKAWRVHGWGEPETMSFEDVPAPEPGPGEVRIRNRAAALNFFDILQVQGKYQIKPPFPFTPGAEVAGIVDATGPDVTQFQPGDRVLSMTHGNGLAEQSVAHVNRTFPVPDGMDFSTAAALPVVYHTSYFALRDRAALQPGEWLLVHAGASGVGVSAIQLGRAFGARVIATAGGAEKVAFAMAQGAQHGIDYTDATWVDQVKQLTGGPGADVIYDPVGGDVFDLSTKCIASAGRLLVIGFASGRIPTIAANRILLKNMSVVGALWGGHVQAHPEYSAVAQRAIADLYSKGKIKPPRPVEYPLATAPAALRDLANRKIFWKAVLTI